MVAPPSKEEQVSPRPSPESPDPSPTAAAPPESPLTFMVVLIGAVHSIVAVLGGVSLPAPAAAAAAAGGTAARSRSTVVEDDDAVSINTPRFPCSPAADAASHAGAAAAVIAVAVAMVGTRVANKGACGVGSAIMPIGVSLWFGKAR